MVKTIPINPILQRKKMFTTRYIHPPIVKELPEHFLKYEYAEQLAKDIEITEGCRYYAILNGSFIFGDFIEALCVVKNYHVKKMTIATLSLNENNIDSLANLINGNYVDEMNLIISGYQASHERHNLMKYLYQELDKDDKFQLALAGTHSKIVLIETHCGKKIVMHGSANLRSNSSIEQMVIEENSALYDFNDTFHDEIIGIYKTINKSVRGKILWELTTSAK